MKKIVLLLTWLALAATMSSTNAQDKDLETAKKLVALAEKSDLSWQILESLTTEVGPRLAGSEADARAVDWAEAKLKALGFDKVWKEKVTFPGWTRGKETAEVISPWPQPLTITTLGGSIGTPAGGLRAEVVVYPTLQALIEADASDVKGKIVFINHRMQRFRDGRGYGPVVRGRGAGAVEAAKKGAVAVIIRSVGTDSHRVPHTGVMRYKEGVPKIPAAALSNPDADQLQRMLDRGKPVNLKLNIGARIGEEQVSYNVIGQINGSEKPDEVIIIGGHLDSWDLGTGAIDDGAGVAITTAAAKLIKEAGFKPRRSIRVVLFANEERGLFGAKAYAEAHKNEIKQHITGSESDFGAGRIYEFRTDATAAAEPLVDQLKEAFKPLGIQYAKGEADGGPDLIPLHYMGMPVFGLSQDGTDYFDLHHTADDTLDKVNPAALRQNTAAYAAFAWLAAQYQGQIIKQSKNNDSAEK